MAACAAAACAAELLPPPTALGVAATCIERGEGNGIEFAAEVCGEVVGRGVERGALRVEAAVADGVMGAGLVERNCN